MPHILLTKKRRDADATATAVSCVYMITGPRGKKYIGKTIAPLRARMGEHALSKYNIGRAIRKHGRAAFSICR